MCYREAMPGSRPSAEHDLPKQPRMVLMDVPAVLVYADGKVGEAHRQRGQYGATVARPFHAKPADRHEISVQGDDRRGDNLTISDVKICSRQPWCGLGHYKTSSSHYCVLCSPESHVQTAERRQPRQRRQRRCHAVVPCAGRDERRERCQQRRQHGASHLRANLPTLRLRRQCSPSRGYTSIDAWCNHLLTCHGGGVQVEVHPHRGNCQSRTLLCKTY